MSDSPSIRWESVGRVPTTQTSTTTLAHRRSTLYMFLDESGNLDRAYDQSHYFMMTCVVARRPFPMAYLLENLRYDLCEQGVNIEKFHACEDNNEVRQAVFGLISRSAEGMSVYSLRVDKTRIPDEQADPASIYSRIFSMLVEEVHQSEALGTEKVVVITDKLPQDARKRQVEKSLKRYMKEKFQDNGIPYYLYHHSSESDMNLQVADYLCWAVQRKYARGKDWPFKAISKNFREIGEVTYK